MTRRSPLVALALAIAIVGVTFALDHVAGDPPEGPRAFEPPSATAPTGGSWLCPVGDGRDGTTLETVVARPEGPGSGPAAVELGTLDEGDTSTTSLSPVFPPSHATETVDAGDGTALVARWSGAPATVTREWRWDGDDDLPQATVAGPCTQPSSPQWTIPGMSSAGGHEARLRLVNPFRTDATVAVHFVTPEGIRAPIALQNWTVPAQSVREINVNEVIPEEDDLAAVVDVATGRLAVEGYQITRSAIGGVDGGSLLAAAPAAAESWTIPWIADDADRTSWLWIVNTGERTAPVELTLHTPDGGDVPDGLAELSVPPGELRRVDLSATLPEGIDTAAVTVRSDGAPVVVSGAVRVAPEEEPDEPDITDLDELDDPDDADPDVADPDDADPDDPEAADDADELGDAEQPTTAAATTGFAVQLGVPDLDRRWTVSGGASADGRGEWLRLVNPSGNDATVSVQLFDGTTLTEPGDLTDVAVPAGTAVSVSISDHLGDVEAWTAFVTATEGQLVVGRVGWGGDGALRLVAVPGAPASSVVPSGRLLAGVETQGLVYRMGTSLGLRAVDPFGATPRPDAPPTTPDDAELDEIFEEDGEVIEPDDPDADDPDADDPDADDPDADDDGVTG